VATEAAWLNGNNLEKEEINTKKEKEEKPLIALTLTGLLMEGHVTQPMNFLSYIFISLAGLLAGAVVGCIGGLALGWLLALSYHEHGPSDPADAPLYVAMGLMLVGACLGAVIGFAIGIIYCVRLTRRKTLAQSA